MLKNYRIDGSVGEIKNSLEDRIQEQNKVALRELSFEELTNFIPKKDFLAETINGVKLEYLIKNESSKTFSSEVKGEQILFHIFQDKIITTFPFFNEVKILIDTIPSNIQVNVSAISSCFKVSDKEGDRIVFNSTSGVYFCTTTSISPYYISTGGSYFTKIEIPANLKGEQINSITGNVYYYLKSVNPVSDEVYDLKVVSFFNDIDRKTDKTLRKFYDYYYIDKQSVRSALNLGDIIETNHPEVQTTIKLTIIAEEKLYLGNVDGVSKVTKNKTLLSSSTKVKIFFSDAREYKLNPVDITNFEEKIFYKCSLNQTSSIITTGPNPTPITIGGGNLVKNIKDEIVDIDVFNSVKNFVNYRFFKNLEGFNKITGKSYEVQDLSYVNINTKINIIHTSVQSQVKQVAPYTPYSLDGRLAVSYLNVVKFSKTGDYTDFNIQSTERPLETDAFERVLQDVSEITFISNWSSGNEKGFVLGTTKELLYFSSIANIFNTTITDRKPIPCSYIPPLKFNINNITSNIIVEAGRTKITGVVPTREQVNNINLTQYVDFFKNDPIKKIQGIAYDDDRLLFVLTDSGKLYGCLTGGSILAWFRIQLQYQTEDIATIDDGFNKKLFITSIIKTSNLVPTNQKLVGSIDFTEGANQIKAEYFIDNSLQDDNVFSEQIPTIANGNAFMLKSELTTQEKQQLPKPMVARMTLHNQEIINKKYNTKASKVKRKISNVNVNVRNSNYFKILYKYNDTNKDINTKTAYEFQKIDDNLNPQRVKELIEIFKPSPAMDNVRLSIETSKNSIVPLIIQSISFDTEYGNYK